MTRTLHIRRLKHAIGRMFDRYICSHPGKASKRLKNERYSPLAILKEPGNVFCWHEQHAPGWFNKQCRRLDGILFVETQTSVPGDTVLPGSYAMITAIPVRFSAEPCLAGTSVS